MAWQDKKFATVDDLLQSFVIHTKPDELVAYRGQPDIFHRLSSSLDRILPRDMAYEARLAEEAAIIVKFCRLAEEFCDSTEKGYLQVPMPQDRIKALPILRHYGAPTRLLDWTRSLWVALYFASIYKHDKDGAVWWFNQKAFYDKVDYMWKEHGLNRYVALGNEVDLNDTAFNTDGPPWISPLGCQVLFHRIEVQQGFFTIAGRLGLEHGDLIANLLDERQYGRIIVPASLKQKVLDRLRTMEIHSKSLDYPGADLVGIDLTNALKQSCRNVNKVEP